MIFQILCSIRSQVPRHPLPSSAYVRPRQGTCRAGQRDHSAHPAPKNSRTATALITIPAKSADSAEGRVCRVFVTLVAP